MAIDTENKRASAANLFLFQVPPAPDATVSAADRSHLDVYAGIVTAALSLAAGLARLVFSVRQPGIAVTVRHPQVVCTARQPSITFTAEG